MIKNISTIRKELENHIQIQLPHSFSKNCIVKYITLKDNEEVFYKGGKYVSFGDNCLWLKNAAMTWSVPIHIKQKDGSIEYTTSFFICDKEGEEEDCEKDKQELNEVIQYQQSILEKMTKTIQQLELQKKYLLDEKKEYHELLQQNRHNFKKLSIQLKEKEEKILKCEDIIQKLANTHPLYHN